MWFSHMLECCLYGQLRSVKCKMQYWGKKRPHQIAAWTTFAGFDTWSLSLFAAKIAGVDQGVITFHGILRVPQCSRDNGVPLYNKALFLWGVALLIAMISCCCPAKHCVSKVVQMVWLQMTPHKWWMWQLHLIKGKPGWPQDKLQATVKLESPAPWQAVSWRATSAGWGQVEQLRDSSLIW